MSTTKKLRSRTWFDNPDYPDMMALYLERYLNYGLTLEELRSGKPIIGIAQSGSDLSPCNRHFLDLSWRIREGIREAGGICIEFPVHPIQETGKRPTAALDRNLAYLGLVEVLYGYPIDGVVLTTGCDKTTPSQLMAAATVNLPAIVLSGGPMLDGHFRGKREGAGTVVWKARELLSAGEINQEQFIEIVASGSPSPGHCNTMGTASTMNSLAEALGMSLTGCAAIPAPYKERGAMAYLTGKRIVEMVHEDLTPSKIMTRAAFENVIATCAAIGGSTNAPWHIIAIARHMGVKLDMQDWQEVGHHIPMLVNMQPVGEHLGEGYYRGGGVPAVMKELLGAGEIREGAMTVTGRTMGENLRAWNGWVNRDVIKPYDKPMAKNAGFLVMSGNLFDSAIMKTSAISEEFRKRYLQRPGDEDAFEGRAIVFEGPEDYHKRINDASLAIDADCILFIRGCGPVGYPGSAEVVNMAAPAYLLKQGINTLPCIGDGRQSGTSGSPSILNASPESAVGGGLALLQTGDKVRVDLKKRRVDMMISDAELAVRRKAWQPPKLVSQTPWQEIYRAGVGQLQTGACLEAATRFQDVVHTMGEPRHSH